MEFISLQSDHFLLALKPVKSYNHGVICSYFMPLSYHVWNIEQAWNSSAYNLTIFVSIKTCWILQTWCDFQLFYAIKLSCLRQRALFHQTLLSFSGMVAFDICAQEGSALAAIQEFYPQSVGRAGTSSSGVGYCTKSANVYKLGRCCCRASPKPQSLFLNSGPLLSPRASC